jgi:hypothetical protein
MPYKYVTAEVEVSLEDFDTDELIDELEIVVSTITPMG